MKLGVIADDFTGASDIALMLRKGGMSVTQFVGIPNDGNFDVDAGVVSLKSRTCPVDDAIAQSLAACRWLVAQGVEQVVFKVCSTFDSTPQGNIGQVAQALAKELSENTVLVCPAFPENGRSVYQGHLFVGDQLLSESGMRNHPLTPMTNSDLRQVLAQQTDWPIAHVPFQKLSQGAIGLLDNVPQGPSMVIVDAIRDEDLLIFGQAAKARKLVVGGSGIAMGLPQNFDLQTTDQAWAGVAGKGVILSGSCSQATRAQVALYGQTEGVQTKELQAEQMLAGSYSVKDIVQWALQQNIAPLIYSSAEPEVVKATQEKFGREASANAFERFFSEFAREFLSQGGQRIVVAGGETSGAVVSGIDAHAMDIGQEIAPGVPALKVSGREIALALKSGNFGQSDFFSRALKALEISHE